MNFTDLLRRKIEDRRDGRSDIVQAAADADARFRKRTALLAAALTAMVETLAADPMFANAMGRPDIIIKRDDGDGQTGSVTSKGRAGDITVSVNADGGAYVQIYPSWVVMQALDCGISYAAEPIRGDLSSIDEFIACICDHLGDFLADIYFSPAAHLLLQPDKSVV